MHFCAPQLIPASHRLQAEKTIKEQRALLDEQKARAEQDALEAADLRKRLREMEQTVALLHPLLRAFPEIPGKAYHYPASPQNASLPSQYHGVALPRCPRRFHSPACAPTRCQMASHIASEGLRSLREGQRPTSRLMDKGDGDGSGGAVREAGRGWGSGMASARRREASASRKRTSRKTDAGCSADTDTPSAEHATLGAATPATDNPTSADVPHATGFLPGAVVLPHGEYECPGAPDRETTKQETKRESSKRERAERRASMLAAERELGSHLDASKDGPGRKVSDSRASTAKPKVGDRVKHTTLGVGTATQLLTDGSMHVVFDGGNAAC